MLTLHKIASGAYRSLPAGMHEPLGDSKKLLYYEFSQIFSTHFYVFSWDMNQYILVHAQDMNLYFVRIQLIEVT